MTEREIFEKYANLSKDALCEKSKKNVYVKNNVMTAVIKHWRGEKKKESKEIQMNLEKKLMIPESEISECPEHDLKSKIGNIFVIEKILEEYSAKIYKKIDSCFYENSREKIKVDKNGVITYYLELMFILLNIF